MNNYLPHPRSKVIFVTYASGEYRKNIFWNKFFVQLFVRPKRCMFLTDDDLKTSHIYKNNRNIFDVTTGAGYWAWKPWAILQAFDQAEPGDVIIYQDCGKGLRYKNIIYPRNIIKHAVMHGVMPGVLIPEHGMAKEWTHKRCFELMGCDVSECTDAPMVEAVISAWLVNGKSRKIVSEWLGCCLNEDIISDKNVKFGSDSYAVKGHRYDQSILTNIVFNWRLEPVKNHLDANNLFKSIALVELLISDTFVDKIFFWSLLQVANIRRRIAFMFIGQKQ